MRNRIVFMFSGQGCQYYHMGAELFRGHPGFRRWMQHLDSLASQILGTSVLRSVFDESRRRGERYDRLVYTHPAIFMVEYALAQVLQESGITPHFVLGVSLGEFTAAAVSGALSLPDALECVIRQAELVERHCPAGGMLAVLDSPAIYHQVPELSRGCELAAINSHSHFVVSGHREAILAAQARLKEQAVLCDLLPVAFGFHSAAVDDAAEPFVAFMRRKILLRPAVPMITCVDGSALDRILPTHFWEAVRRPMRFREALRGLEAMGSALYLDVGPSGVLANFVKYNLPAEAASRAYAVMTPLSPDISSLERVIAAASPRL